MSLTDFTGKEYIRLLPVELHTKTGDVFVPYNSYRLKLRI